MVMRKRKRRKEVMVVRGVVMGRGCMGPLVMTRPRLLGRGGGGVRGEVLRRRPPKIRWLEVTRKGRMVSISFLLGRMGELVLISVVRHIPTPLVRRGRRPPTK